MIYTLTANPAIDYYLFFDNELSYGINRTGKYSFEAGGKGVNVSRVLASFREENICVILTGGFSGEYIGEQLEKEDFIKVRNVPLEGISRINVKIRCAGKELDINTSGPQVDGSCREDFLAAFAEIKANDIVCFNGSLQAGVSELLAELAGELRKKGARLVMDVPNLTLEEVLAYKPYLIKPNEEELQQLLHTDSVYPQLAMAAQKTLGKEGVKVLLSLGKDGSCYIDESRIIKLSVPPVKAVNTVAAGDSLLAGFIYALNREMPLETCLRYAASGGTAAVMRTELPSVELISTLLDQIILTEVK